MYINFYFAHKSARIQQYWKLHQSAIKHNQQSIYWSAICHTNLKFNSMMHHINQTGTLISKSLITSTNRYCNYIVTSFVTAEPQYWFCSLQNLFRSSTVTCKWTTICKECNPFHKQLRRVDFSVNISLALHWEWIQGYRGSLFYIFVIWQVMVLGVCTLVSNVARSARHNHTCLRIVTGCCTHLQHLYDSAVQTLWLVFCECFYLKI